MTTLIVDNYDSFTFNIAQLLAGLGEPTLVVRNDDRTGWNALDWGQIDRVVISPGPGTPDNVDDLGLSREAIVARSRPLLGICLGHQALCTLSGGRVRRAREPMHGRISTIAHHGDALFDGIPRAFRATRYHSLVVDDLPPSLEAVCWTDGDVVMGVRHREWPAWGLQFHPESVGSDYGARILANFLTLTAAPDRNDHGAPIVATTRPACRAEAGDRVIGGLAAVWRELDVVPDPVAAMDTLFADNVDGAFWLDTVADDADTARSYLGAAMGSVAETLSYRVDDGFVSVAGNDGVTRRVAGSVFDYLDGHLTPAAVPTPLPATAPIPLNLGYVGWLGYELRDLGGAPHGRRAPHPDAFLVLADRMLVIDHGSARAWLAALSARDDQGAARAWLDEAASALRALPASPPWDMPAMTVDLVVTSRHGRDDYASLIDRCQELIRAGESYELCLTNQLQVAASVDAFALFRVLRASSPAPYSAYFRGPGVTVVGASPERFLAVADGVICSKPMKGTRPRGSEPSTDAALRAELVTSPKERAENLMITDLVRNDLGSVAVAGSVTVDALCAVESYPHVHQLVSTVSARLSPGRSVVDVVRASFPGGSMTGAPKRRSTEILDVLEDGYRGIYSGALGFLTLDGGADLSMVIRTAVVTPHEVTVGVGGAITALSDPQAEVAEMVLKGAAVLAAIAAAATLEPTAARSNQPARAAR